MAGSDNDLSNLLAEWPWESGRMHVRRVEVDDHRRVIQIRVQLGILQLEEQGRPDGLRPEGYESVLHHVLERFDAYTQANGSSTGFFLTSADCRALRDEAVLYYHRYVALFVLEDYEGVIRDTTRNLIALDLCRDFAETASDREMMEPTRPHILTMRTRARACNAIQNNDGKAALAIIDEGLEEVTQALAEIGFGDRVEQSNDVQLLRGMREALVPKLPASERAELRARLRAALDAENYELAAILRDELRMLGG